MTIGVFYGIGIGPGDPDLITLKAAKILSQCRTVFVPKARATEESTALGIAGKHLHPRADIRELVFPMTMDKAKLRQSWIDNAGQVAAALESGADAAFLTLGDAMLYSTYIYLVRALRDVLPGVEIITVAGITAFSAAAALTHFPVGTGKLPATIVPTSDDLDELRRILQRKGTKVLMKIGRRLDAILDVLEETGLLDGSLLVSRVGMDNQRVETELRALRGRNSDVGYLSIILVPAAEEEMTS
ncbi:MAG: precorrin-2 C(20)-methyltransferase [Desulfobacteraceae bacterium]|nr:MAG: precorrin-2 C(20)-methyltransferase [Desulfobacteraceae bacterium]